MRRWFMMEPHKTPSEPSREDGVLRVLREHVAYTAAARAETRLARQQIEELTMKVSELSGKVDTLISLAKDYRTAADSAAAVGMPEDDPEVAEIGDRIDRAIAELQGTGLASTSPETTPGVGKTPVFRDPAGNADPNAPV